jgi:hypothetical protein
MKYQAGDRIKIIKIIDSKNSIDGIEPDYLIYKTGIITEVRIDREYPYTVKFDDERAKKSGMGLWHEEELRLINSNGECCLTCGRLL